MGKKKVCVYSGIYLELSALGQYQPLGILPAQRLLSARSRRSTNDKRQQQKWRCAHGDVKSPLVCLIETVMLQVPRNACNTQTCFNEGHENELGRTLFCRTESLPDSPRQILLGETDLQRDSGARDIGRLARTGLLQFNLPLVQGARLGLVKGMR